MGRDLTESGQIDVAEPFLPPCARFDTLDPGAAPGNWLLAGVLEALEELDSHSSFYTGIVARERLALMARLGFESAEMRRRRELVAERFPS